MTSYCSKCTPSDNKHFPPCHVIGQRNQGAILCQACKEAEPGALMAGPPEKCCACRTEQSQVLGNVMHAVEESLALPTQICVNVVALQGKWSWRKAYHTQLNAFTHSSWLVSKRKRVFGMTPTLVGRRSGETQRAPEWPAEANPRGSCHTQWTTIGVLVLRPVEVLRQCVFAQSSDWHWSAISPSGCCT